MAEKAGRWSFELQCAESMTDAQLTRSTMVTVVAESLAEARGRARAVLGDEAQRKTVFWPSRITELID